MGTYYNGPGKVYLNSKGLQAQGENGQITLMIDEKTDEAATGMHGRIGETWADQTGKITITPFDNWGVMATLYPTFLGITTAGGTGALSIGSQAPTGANVPCKIW